jgi:hypothetical protein
MRLEKPAALATTFHGDALRWGCRTRCSVVRPALRSRNAICDAPGPVYRRRLCVQRGADDPRIGWSAGVTRPGESGDSVPWEGWSHVGSRDVAEVAVGSDVPAKRNRFIKLVGADKSVNRDLEAKARGLAARLQGSSPVRWGSIAAHL